ncbi:YhcN/YlaJ family sporulation lipoprotein [Brevibacillus composti]|uniref:YhcN/YlaJ family sporulation lipoprotein n=1 Tax=Brevibacillus composti TaxID=2796470 RepID=UPI0038990F24
MNKKSWLLQAVAGIALLTAACGNNAAPAPDATNNGTRVNQAAPRLFNTDKASIYNNAPGAPGGQAMTNFPYTDSGVGNYGFTNNAVTNGYTFGTNNPRTGIGPNAGTDAALNGYRSYNAFTDNGTRALNRNGNANQSIYRANNGVGTMSAATMPHTGFVQVHSTDVRGTGAGTMGNRTGTAGVTGFGPGGVGGAGGAGTGANGGAGFGAGMGAGAGATNGGYGANNVYVDRQALARAVGNVAVSCPGVDRATVLVTDEEVFVGLNTQGPNARTAKNQARANALSVTPRYYKVYVTDNPQHIDEISRVASRTTNGPVIRAEDTRQFDALVKRMGGTVDGEEMRTKGSSMTTETNRGQKAKQGMGTSSR